MTLRIRYIFYTLSQGMTKQQARSNAAHLVIAYIILVQFPSAHRIQKLKTGKVCKAGNIRNIYFHCLSFRAFHKL